MLKSWTCCLGSKSSRTSARGAVRCQSRNNCNHESDALTFPRNVGRAALIRTPRSSPPSAAPCVALPATPLDSSSVCSLLLDFSLIKIQFVAFRRQLIFVHRPVISEGEMRVPSGLRTSRFGLSPCRWASSSWVFRRNRFLRDWRFRRRTLYRQLRRNQRRLLAFYDSDRVDGTGWAQSR
jgi:hypothetical protein